MRKKNSTDGVTVVAASGNPSTYSEEEIPATTTNYSALNMTLLGRLFSSKRFKPARSQVGEEKRLLWGWALSLFYLAVSIKSTLTRFPFLTPSILSSFAIKNSTTNSKYRYRIVTFIWAQKEALLFILIPPSLIRHFLLRKQGYNSLRLLPKLTIKQQLSTPIF